MTHNYPMIICIYIYVCVILYQTMKCCVALYCQASLLTSPHYDKEVAHASCVDEMTMIKLNDVILYHIVKWYCTAMVSRCNVWMIWIDIYWKMQCLPFNTQREAFARYIYIHTHIYIYMYIFLRVHINIWATTMYVNCFRSHSMIWFYSPITTNIFPRSMVCLVLWLKEQIIYRENAYFQYYITIYYSWLGHIWWWTNLVSGCF